MTATRMPPDEAVCAECIEDEFFQEYIQRHADSRECSYCGRAAGERIAVDVETIIKRIRGGLGYEWEAAVESMPWVDGEYLFRTYDTREVLMEVGFYAGNEALHDRIIAGLPDGAWVEKDWQVGTRDEILQNSWDRFSYLVKHRHRYLFFHSGHEPSYNNPEIPPTEMLDHVAELLRNRELVTEIPKGAGLVRVRIHHPAEHFTDLGELCSPPLGAAKYANRMSPAGVSAFYASENADTAIAETDQGKRPAVATVATFRATAPLLVVDFVGVPPVPSLFDDLEQRAERPVLIFLHGFIRSLTRPIEKDQQEHIEYVPSQVVTEFLRDRFTDHDGRAPAGLKYPSAARDGGESCVLFYTHDDFTSDWLPEGREKPPLALTGVARTQL